MALTLELVNAAFTRNSARLQIRFHVGSAVGLKLNSSRPHSDQVEPLTLHDTAAAAGAAPLFTVNAFLPSTKHSISWGLPSMLRYRLSLLLRSLKVSRMYLPCGHVRQATNQLLSWYYDPTTFPIIMRWFPIQIA